MRIPASVAALACITLSVAASAGAPGHRARTPPVRHVALTTSPAYLQLVDETTVAPTRARWLLPRIEEGTDTSPDQPVVKIHGKKVKIRVPIG